MKKSSKLSGREGFLVGLLVVLLIGVVYYMGFYKPLQEELTELNAQISEIEVQINGASSRISQMDAMQKELDEIFARPESQITEIAPYDNKEVVLNQLNGILQASLQYSLNFSEPSIGSDGTVRRNVSMNFSCPDYNSAKAIIRALTESHWRCLVSNLSLSGGGNIMDGEVSVNATITFFERTNVE